MYFSGRVHSSSDRTWRKAKTSQGHGQHAEDAHQGGVAVIRGEDGAHFEVADDGQIDEEPEDAGAYEIPEAHRHEEVEGPFVRNRQMLPADLALRPGQLDEVPGIQGQAASAARPPWPRTSRTGPC